MWLEYLQMANFAVLEAVDEQNCTFALPANQVLFVDHNRNEIKGVFATPVPSEGLHSSAADSMQYAEIQTITTDMVRSLINQEANDGRNFSQPFASSDIVDE